MEVREILAPARILMESLMSRVFPAWRVLPIGLLPNTTIKTPPAHSSLWEASRVHRQRPLLHRHQPQLPLRLQLQHLHLQQRQFRNVLFLISLAPAQMRLSQFGATRGSQPRLTRSAQWAIRSRRKVFLRDISAFVAPQRSPLPLNEIRDHVLAFFVG